MLGMTFVAIVTVGVICYRHVLGFVFCNLQIHIRARANKEIFFVHSWALTKHNSLKWAWRTHTSVLPFVERKRITNNNTTTRIRKWACSNCQPNNASNYAGPDEQEDFQKLWNPVPNFLAFFANRTLMRNIKCQLYATDYHWETLLDE